MITKRIDRVTEIAGKYLNTVIPTPPSVKIELTALCDLRCFFCASSNGLRKRGEMEFSFLEKTLRELKEVDVKEIGLFYLGESLLYPRLADAIRLAKDIGFEYVFLTTNGHLLTKEKAHKIISAGLDSLKLSFNFPDRKTYKDLTGVEGYDIVIANIKNAHKIRQEVFESTGHWCGLYASSIKYKNIDMSDAIGEIKDSVDEHYWLPLYNQAGYYPDGGAGNPGRIGALRPVLPCWQLFKEGHITWTGMLVGCCFAYEPKWDFGDLNKMSFMEAWNSPQAQRLRESSLKGDVTGTACDRCVNG